MSRYRLLGSDLERFDVDERDGFVAEIELALAADAVRIVRLDSRFLLLPSPTVEPAWQ